MFLWNFVFCFVLFEHLFPNLNNSLCFFLNVSNNKKKNFYKKYLEYKFLLKKRNQNVFLNANDADTIFLFKFFYGWFFCFGFLKKYINNNYLQGNLLFLFIRLKSRNDKIFIGIVNDGYLIKFIFIFFVWRRRRWLCRGDHWIICS